MTGPGQLYRNPRLNIGKCAPFAQIFWLGLVVACNRPAAEKAPELSDAARAPGSSPPLAQPSSLSARATALPPFTSSKPADSLAPAPIEKIDFQDTAMGTNVHF